MPGRHSPNPGEASPGALRSCMNTLGRARLTSGVLFQPRVDDLRFAGRRECGLLGPLRENGTVWGTPMRACRQRPSGALPPRRRCAVPVRPPAGFRGRVPRTRRPS